MGRQLPDVCCEYGAPMGRLEYGLVQDAGKIRLFRVRIDAGGYDDGSAYWGFGLPLYCATDGADYRRFIRAKSRDDARVLLGIYPAQLVRR